MGQNLRTFVAIKIQPGTELQGFIDQCRKVFDKEAIKWVEGNNLHLTLKFLGETSEKQVGEIIDVLKNISDRFQPFSFKLNGPGYFKSKGQPRVLLVHISDSGQMKMIAGELENQLYDLGFERETREFRPHLTLGRIKFLKDKKRFYQFVEKYKNEVVQVVPVSEIIFYQSILKPQGPEYIPLKVVQFHKKLVLK
jgi:2'-5' RNA ligase